MTDFSHLSKLAVANDRTIPYALHQLDGSPQLDVLPATEANKPYYNELLRRGRSNARRARALGLNSAILDESRDEDRELFAKHIVRGWSGIVDSAGVAVPFSVEACLEFLAALPNWLFDDLRGFCGDPSNFLRRDEKAPAEAKATAKN